MIIQSSVLALPYTGDLHKVHSTFTGSNAKAIKLNGNPSGY